LLTPQYTSPSQNDLDSATAVLSESLEVAETTFGTCEDVLDWPIFEGKLPRSEIEALIFNPNHAVPEPALAVQLCQSGAAAETRWHRSFVPRGGVDETNALFLVRKFLANVHIKNPVLDATDLKQMAKEITEEGFQWDGRSCLVVRKSFP
jgi:hypothetical protein